MNIRSSRDRLLASTILVSAAFVAAGASPAAAQQLPPTTTAGQEPASATASPTAVQEVVVTGSRIRQPNLTSTSPLTVVTSQEAVFEGTTNVESLLNNLPQITANETSQLSNGTTGTATVSLRNLGPNRTLVLVDGKRLQPGDSLSAGAADLNNIPATLIDRIDVVTGGASAVYGSDAVAGVVNFILKKNFEGLRLDAQAGFFNHQNSNSQADAYLAAAPYLSGPVAKPGDVGADGFTYDVTAILGANSPDDKGNITVYGNYRHLVPVLQSTRDFSACAEGTTGATNNIHACNGSSNNAYGRFDNTGPKNSFTGRGTASAVNNPDGTQTFVPYSQALSYNFNPANYLQREDDTYRAGFFAHYKISEKIEVYSDFMFTSDDTNAQIAPAGFFSGTGPNLATGYTFNCNNPFLSAAQASALCSNQISTPQADGSKIITTGAPVVITPGAPGGTLTTQSIRYRFATTPRNDDIRHTDYKIDIGARGDLGEGWHYDAYLQYGSSVLNELTTNYPSEINLQNALNVINDPITGKPRCVTNDTRCSPLNIFQAQGAGFTKAALNYVLVPAFTSGTATEQIASINVNGDLGQYGIKSPLANDGVGVAFGTEYRREAVSTSFDQELLEGDLSGGGGQSGDVSGSFDVYELFTEARIPVVADKPFVHDLSIDVGYRFSDYSSSGDTSTYKGEANYAPTPDVRVRFSYNHAVRAPSAVELFSPTLSNLGSYQDPCSNAPLATPQYTKAQCALTGLNPGLYGLISPCASSQCEIQTSGDAALKPEVADTYSLGAVFTPRFIRGFSASVDYFNINITNVITTGASPSTILSECVSGVTADCALITRDSQGTINSPQGYVEQHNQNSGSLFTRGVDFTANYRLSFADIPLPYVSSVPGALAFALVGTYTQNLTFQPIPLQGHYDCAGLFGPECGVPQPHWRGSFRTTYITPFNATISLNWRYIGGSKLDYNDNQPLLNGGAGFYDIADRKIAPYGYFDLAATYKFRDRYTFRAGVNNILDKDPPIIDSNGYGISGPPYGNGNTYPGIYDSLGRTIFLGVTADF